jgi:hypothetical protein
MTGIDYVPEITLSGLFNLLSLCPALELLAIDLDARVLKLKLSYPPSMLRVLALGWSPIEDLDKVAVLFNKMLPKLQFILRDEQKMRVDDEDDAAFGRLWWHVEDVLFEWLQKEDPVVG